MSQPTFVVGTAGHVDHGKSSLVRELTGTDPDRLLEEQLRQMTIDLGFAELTTPGGKRVHLVDVPGHERFVRNMLAGAGGIDAAILVIAADDGPMPQTREHLAILDLLGIERGVVALSKADLVDEEWLGFVAESIRELLDGTSLAGSEIVSVSSITGEGLSALQVALDRALDSVQRTPTERTPRLPIDRVFSMPGFGTVVTGTLLEGAFRIGERIAIYPTGITTRIRGLQTFGASVSIAYPGSRVAVNLTGLETEELARGDVLAPLGAIEPTMRLDALVRLIDASERPLRHNDDVVVFSGSFEIPAKAALLDAESIDPGAEGWVQLRLSRPAAVMARDRFILRRPSPAETIGGGVILELDPPRHKRFQPAVVERLTHLAAGDPADLMMAWLGSQFVSEADLRAHAPDEVVAALAEAGQIRFLGTSDARIVAASITVDAARARIRETVDRYHTERPLEPGMPRELLRQMFGLDRTAFDTVVAGDPELEEEHSLVRRSGFEITLDEAQQTIVDRFLDVLGSAGFQPPAPGELGIPAELVQAMIALRSVVSVGDGIVFLPERIDEAEQRLRLALATGNSISLAEYRDLLGTTRKYTQALLEYFDRQRVTRRVGDRRVAIGPVREREDDRPL
ncbi:MAG TPA: selenocysteine-specific translation elongation factor [Thermomicrobiales bacterium]|nr:selenocysteine-specific translation elongation factor [Thermomicrobiales bacterium]